jgi:ABC-type lipoprotein release transport system permease subunit
VPPQFLSLGRWLHADWNRAVNVFVAVIVFCSLASFFPAWRAARMDPVQALRKE